MDKLLDTVINETEPTGRYRDLISSLARQVHAADCRSARVVIFGGGTGLSTVVGGNSRLDDWPQNPFVGLKQEFPLLDVVVCTTDDGGSTGLLLRQFPMIGIGDLRKVLLSMILKENLQATYRLDDNGTLELLGMIQTIFNYRFPKEERNFRYLKNPLLVVPQHLRRRCPQALRTFLSSLGSYISPGGEGPVIPPAGHCLGNLLLTSAILRSAGKTNSYPTLAAIAQAFDTVSKAIGTTPGCVHAATATPGQLVLRYANGVAVRGQGKSAVTRRLFPIDRVWVEYSDTPKVSETLCHAIKEADLILYAPGSLYTSIMPILQLVPIVQAIRENRNALKILGANFWIQEGETDISRRGSNRGLYVSELVEAYDANVPGGADGLFDVVLSANLDRITGDVVRNYALEGKSPLYLDRSGVERLGILPVEATVYSLERLKSAGVIHHDPQKFALAVRALLVAHRSINLKRSTSHDKPHTARLADAPCTSGLPLCSYYSKTGALLAKKSFSPKGLQETMHDILWENRDIRIEHVDFFRGARIIPAAGWTRSNKLDNVLGYYDPKDGLIKIHEQAAGDPEEIRAGILIALGESLLGRYIGSRRWVEPGDGSEWGARRYEIRLRPERERASFLNDDELRTYLKLARMQPNPHDPDVFGITLNDGEGFLPPGLLFGLLYAWYLNNAYGRIIEYEMSLLHWPPEKLIPYQLEEYRRKQGLITFFRNVVFRHKDE